MNDDRTVIEQAVRQLRPAPGILDRIYERRRKRQRNQRIAAATVALAVVALVVASAVALGREASAPRVSPAGSLRMHNGSIDVFGFTDGVRTLDQDGKGRFVVKCGSCTKVDFASWSPDGSRLAFSASCGGSCASAGDPYHGLRTFDLTTGLDRMILAGEGIGPLAWSADGSRIAYVTHGHLDPPHGWIWDPTASIMVMDAEGGHQVHVVSGLSGEETPQSISWSPDGTQLAYSDFRSTSVVGIDGPEPRTLTDGTAAAWSPDGNSIAYLSNCVVRVISSAGLDDHALVDLLDVEPTAEACDGIGDLVWSPDGTKLAVLADRGPADPQRSSHKSLFVLDADGSHPDVLSDGLDDVHGLTWQPLP
jgi:Tol biopolymer transport system component